MSGWTLLGYDSHGKSVGIPWIRPMKAVFFAVFWRWKVVRCGTNIIVSEGYAFTKKEAISQAMAWSRCIVK